MALDQGLQLAKADPFSSAALASVQRLSDDGWRVAARVAGCNPPSTETRTLVVAVYAQRLEHAGVGRMDGMDRTRNRAHGIGWCP